MAYVCLQNILTSVFQVDEEPAVGGDRTDGCLAATRNPFMLAEPAARSGVFQVPPIHSNCKIPYLRLSFYARHCVQATYNFEEFKVRELRRRV